MAGRAMMFATGDEVEVSSKDEGFRGAWYEARVARSKPYGRLYTVVYDHLVDDGENPRPLRETVKAAYVRPRPPRRGGLFPPHLPIDARYNDGWWVGVAVRGRGEAAERYTVCFPDSREEMEFPAADLRAHLEWVGGEWVEPDEVTPGTAAMAFPIGTHVEVSRNRRDSLPAWFVATVQKLILKSYLLVKYQSLKADDKEECLKEVVDVQHVRPCPPRVSGKKCFNLLEQVEVLHDDGWCMGVVSRNCGGSRYIVKSKHWEGEMKFSQDAMRLRHEWTDGEWVLATKESMDP